MSGGGAERVASQLLNEFKRKGADCTFIMTSMSVQEAVNTDLQDGIRLISLKDEKTDISVFLKIKYAIMFLIATFFCKLFEIGKKKVPARFAYMSFVSQNYREIINLEKYLKQNKNATVISFLQPSIPITMLASRNLPNKVIFSERADPNRLMKKRYGERFIKKYYQRADAAVFQTQEAKNAYPENIALKGTVIPNPVKADLPEVYQGERNKNITTFCRISAQKNLMVLLKAFRKLYSDYPEYSLRIIGDALNEEGRLIEGQMKEYIKEYSLEKSVLFEPFNANIHKAIIKDAMYVNSSDYEGISNAMLEAMAIGMPTVCTDCPIGGARATIKDGENGLLVPVNDVDALYNAMKRIIENRALSEKLSENGAKIREELSLEKTAQKWMELI